MTSKTFRAAGRLLLVLLGVILAVMALRDAVSRMRAPVAPDVLQSIPADGRLVGMRFDYQLRKNGGAKLPEEDCWPCNARDAISRDPLDPAPLRILGLYAEREGRTDAALRYMQLAERISRRDAVTQGWMIQESVRRRDLSGVLKHFDRLLSTHDELYPVIFPRLAQTLTAPEIQAGLAEYIRRDRPWVSSFMIEVGPMVADPRHLKAMYEKVDLGKGPLETTLRGQRLLVSQLASAGHYDDALSQARRIAGKDLAEIDGFGFPNGEPADAYLPLTWTQGADRTVATRFEGVDGAVVENGSGSTNLAFYRVRLLAPGRYVLTQTATAVDGYPPLVGRWSMFCIKGQSADRLADLAVTPGAGEKRVAFTVTANCDAVRFDFDAMDGGSDGVALLRLEKPDLRRQS